MGKKNNRVTRELFSSILKSGVTYHSRHFSFRVVKKGTTHIHTAFVVPKKVAGGAVLRNKIKRRGYYTVHTLSGGFKTPFTGIFFVKKGAAALPYRQYKEEVTSLLRRAKLL